MSTVVIPASRTYEVQIEDRLPADAGERVRAAVPGAARAAILADDTVWGLYGQELEDRLTGAGLTVFHHVFPHGEASKNASVYIGILEWLSRCRMDRQDVLLALGGGVTGDLGGFAAATYLRGIAYIQVPTTLLAMVDSSVGGKTAIDLSAGKNLAGAFWQPSLVLCGCSALGTLPRETLADGCAEVVKYGVLCDPELFRHLEERGLDFDRTWAVEHCVRDKQGFVSRDEFDRGARKLLNLGHTLGHALEQRSGFTLSHGRGVSIGMATVTRAAAVRGWCSAELRGRLERLLEKLELPVRSPWPVEELEEFMLADKKWSGSRADIVVPERLGHCGIRPMDQQELMDFMEAGCRE
ncbi:MAG: 3-dehydroquinate synthase [Oscillospiraceae bacterium]|nr:3-dehydroquinate synthase [Oscillospiraceae bacterium]